MNDSGIVLIVCNLCVHALDLFFTHWTLLLIKKKRCLDLRMVRNGLHRFRIRTGSVLYGIMVFIVFFSRQEFLWMLLGLQVAVIYLHTFNLIDIYRNWDNDPYWKSLKILYEVKRK